MENTSPFLAMQRVEGQMKTLLRSIDLESLEPAERKAAAKLKMLAVEARLDIRDYELSETRPEQLENAVKAKNRVFKLEATLLVAGMAFGPADIAQLSAQLDQINDRLV